MTIITEHIVVTQDELDQALADPDVDRVIIDSKPDAWLQVTSNGVSAVWGTTSIEVCGSSYVEARESSHINARESSHIKARGSS